MSVDRSDDFTALSRRLPHSISCSLHQRRAGLDTALRTWYIGPQGACCECRSTFGDLDDSFRKGPRGLLRQIVSDSALDDSV
jgi:hypothetical protein